MKYFPLYHIINNLTSNFKNGAYFLHESYSREKYR